MALATITQIITLTAANSPACVCSDETYRKLAAILFTDMVGYSALAQRNEAPALQLPTNREIYNVQQK